MYQRRIWVWSLALQAHAHSSHSNPLVEVNRAIDVDKVWLAETRINRRGRLLTNPNQSGSFHSQCFHMIRVVIGCFQDTSKNNPAQTLYDDPHRLIWHSTNLLNALLVFALALGLARQRAPVPEHVFRSWVSACAPHRGLFNSNHRLSLVHFMS